MKTNNIFTFIALITSLAGANIHAMKPRKPRPTGPNISPLHKRVLEDAAAKDHGRIIEEIKSELPEKLNRLYAETLRTTPYTADDNRPMDESEQEIFCELQNLAEDQLCEYYHCEERVGELIPLDELNPIIDAFKTERGFAGLTKIKSLQLGALSKFYATYLALNTALKHVDWRIGLD